MTPNTIPPICEPRVYYGIAYSCGRTLLYRDPTDPGQACPGGTFICANCVKGVGYFLKRSYDAQAVRREWEGG